MGLKLIHVCKRDCYCFTRTKIYEIHKLINLIQLTFAWPVYSSYTKWFQSYMIAASKTWFCWVLRSDTDHKGKLTADISSCLSGNWNYETYKGWCWHLEITILYVRSHNCISETNVYIIDRPTTNIMTMLPMIFLIKVTNKFTQLHS